MSRISPFTPTLPFLVCRSSISKITEYETLKSPKTIRNTSVFTVTPYTFPTLTKTIRQPLKIPLLRRRPIKLLLSSGTYARS